jgi:hypothetical protein
VLREIAQDHCWTANQCPYDKLVDRHRAPLPIIDVNQKRLRLHPSNDDSGKELEHSEEPVLADDDVPPVQPTLSSNAPAVLPLSQAFCPLCYSGILSASACACPRPRF